MQCGVILDSLPTWVVQFDDDLTVRYVNAPLAAAIGVPAAELVGRPARDLGLDPTHYGDWLGRARSALDRNEAGDYTFFPPPPAPSVVRFQFAPQPGTKTLVVAVTTDRSADPGVVELFCRLMNHAPFSAWLRDESSRYLFVNSRYRQAAGPGVEWIGKHPNEVWPPEVAEQFVLSDQKVFGGGRPIESLDTAPAADGTVRTWHCVKFPLVDVHGRRYAAGISIDLTDRLKLEEERRQLERQLLHAQKLESLGVMAGGVAHDFNNLLTTILGNASLARMNVSDPSPMSECLKKVESAAMRAAELCQQMLAYSGRGQLMVRDVDLNALVRDTISVLGSVLSRRAVVEFHPTDPLPAVRGDAGQLRQVILNLLTNASDALSDVSGVITIRTGTLTADAEYLNKLAMASHLSPGVYSFVEVTDTGVGMDQGTLAHIFEPFFTTKFAGRGLGLSAVQGIVRGHRGAVQTVSQVGKGSTFTVLLPVALSTAAAGTATGERAGRGRTVLVIDDEDDVRLVARRLLESAGFNVLLAIDGVDGVSTFGNFYKQVSVVLLDLSMPRLGGAGAFHELKRIDSDVRVILTSGYGRQVALEAFGEDRPSAFLRKPFTGEELLTAVYQVVGP